jgi:hypothetical protein
MNTSQSLPFNTAMRCLGLVLCAFLSGCGTNRVEPTRLFAPKLPPPQPFVARTADGRPGPFEQQFRIDTGQTNLTPRSETAWPLRIKSNHKDRVLLRFDLSAWPESLRPAARLWIGIGASNAFTTEVIVNLSFSQNGVGVTVPLNNSIAIDDVALMGCDFAVQDGDVTVDIDNHGLARDVDYTLHAIVYVPKKLDPN